MYTYIDTAVSETSTAAAITQSIDRKRTQQEQRL